MGLVSGDGAAMREGGVLLVNLFGVGKGGHCVRRGLVKVDVQGKTTSMTKSVSNKCAMCEERESRREEEKLMNDQGGLYLYTLYHHR
jgi:hypothetical protein